ncbi:MAG: HU family DNA-binding protein [Gemmatimonadota bacterium]
MQEVAPENELGGRMTKADLVEQIAEATGLTKKDTAVVVDGFLEAVKQAMAQEKNIEIRGFGSFKIKKRKARKARNPRTGDPVQVPSRHVPTFKPSKELKELITAMPAQGAGAAPGSSTAGYGAGQTGQPAREDSRGGPGEASGSSQAAPVSESVES